MAKKTFSDKINQLFAANEWDEARELLDAKCAKGPESHWILTQLGVTYYEQRRYREALRLFLKSTAIVPDCPLTSWNLGGVYDALGKHDAAIDIYTGILKRAQTSDEDPCWESEAWATALKTDCVFALGTAYQHMGDQALAEHCYRQYIDLLLIGIEGSYPIEDARRRIQSLHAAPNGKEADVELKKLRTYLARHGSAGNGRGKTAARTQARV